MKKLLSHGFLWFQIVYDFCCILIERIILLWGVRRVNIDKDNKPIDIVYLWVDGSDPKWIEKKNKYKTSLNNNDAMRFQQIDELKYSLRSLEKYAIWIRNIYIVTDDQVPNRLDINHPKIKIIDHTDILDTKSLPCFNAFAIELQVHNIDGLSDYFLYANDDMFFGNRVDKSDFLSAKGIKIFPNPSCGIITRTMKQGRHTYESSWINIYQFFKKHFGLSRPILVHHHQIKMIDKNIMDELKSKYRDIYNDIKLDKFRTNDSLQAIARNNIYACYKKKASLGFMSQMYIGGDDGVSYIQKIKMFIIRQFKPKLFCINSGGNVNNRGIIQSYLETLFPDKSAFEK